MRPGRFDVHRVNGVHDYWDMPLGTKRYFSPWQPLVVPGSKVSMNRVVRPHQNYYETVCRSSPLRLALFRLYKLLKEPCIWKNGKPFCNGFAFILSIIALVFIVKAAPVLVAGSPGLLLYKPAKAIWKKWFG